jgi:acetyl-CoA carboxylase biotin carboxyl carrier protein
MDFKKTEEMIKLMRAYGLSELEIKSGDDSIRIVQSSGPIAYQPSPMMQPIAVPSFHGSVAPVASSQETVESVSQKKHRGALIHSPFVGTFYRSSGPGESPFVEVGKQVKKGQTLCIIEAMKIMNEIEADRDGVIREILAENESPVEFDQALFVIE